MSLTPEQIEEIRRLAWDHDFGGVPIPQLCDMALSAARKEKARDEVIEECAMVCDARAAKKAYDLNDSYARTRYEQDGSTARKLAVAIRELKARAAVEEAGQTEPDNRRP